jgi:predicted transcriptional regulator
VGTTNVTVRLNEDELRRLDELSQRMGKIRSDVIRSLINDFNEALRQEAEREKKRWVAMGFVGALESIILDPTLVLRFVRKNVDVLSYPDFIIGMVRVKNRVVFFSHQDKVGHQLLQLVRPKVEEDVRREEAEIEREEDEDEEAGGAKPIPTHPRVKVPIKPGTPHAVPGAHRYKVLVNSRGASPVAKPIAANTVGRLVNNDGEGGAKSTASTTAPDPKKLAGEKLAGAGSPNAQPISPTQRASTNGSGKDVSNPVGQGINHELNGDFVFALIANSYHKHRDRLLKLMESIAGD